MRAQPGAAEAKQSIESEKKSTKSVGTPTYKGREKKEHAKGQFSVHFATAVTNGQTEKWYHEKIVKSEEKQPGNGTQERKKKTARDKDPKTFERKEQLALQAVTCESDAKARHKVPCSIREPEFRPLSPRATLLRTRCQLW